MRDLDLVYLLGSFFDQLAAAAAAAGKSLLRWVADELEWDGNGYATHEVCVDLKIKAAVAAAAGPLLRWAKRGIPPCVLLLLWVSSISAPTASPGSLFR